jgi:chromosome segregation ATPase
MAEDYNSETKSTGSWQLPAIIVLGLIAIGGLAFGWNASSKLDATQQSVAAQVKSMQQSVDQDMTSLKDRLAQSEKTNAEFQGDLKVVTDKLKITQGQLKKAREEAAQNFDAASQKLTALDTSVHTELATKAGTEDLKNVDTKVGGVRTDLDQTRDDLKMARSEMGTLISQPRRNRPTPPSRRARLRRVHHSV